jgi:transposase
MTVPGVNLIVAVTFLAAVGNIERFPDRRKLVAYLGLDPKVRQSGDAPATHGHISKQGSAPVRVALVEASWSAVRNPGPLRSFYQRIRARRGHQVAITAAARKLACLFWVLLWRQEDYAFGQPTLTAKSCVGWRSPRARRAGKIAAASGSPTACSETPNSTWPDRPSRPTPRPSATAKPPARSRRARARHRGAHHNSPQRAKPRGRPQAPDACASLRQSPASTNTIPQELPPHQTLTFIRHPAPTARVPAATDAVPRARVYADLSACREDEE